jgi:hypothetical protein
MSDAPPGMPITVTMTLLQWRNLIAVLAKAPYETVAPFIGEIDRQAGPQLQAAAAQREALPEHMPMRPNGGAGRPEVTHG